MLKISNHCYLNENEVEFTFIRASGPGGQNVNKVATGVVLRFNIINSHAINDDVKQRIRKLINVSAAGDIIIKAIRHRTQERNKQDAWQRLKLLLQTALIEPKHRHKTSISRKTKQKRLASKKLHGQHKALRAKLNTSDD